MTEKDDMDDIEQIKRLKARYARGVDFRDWDGFRSVFADDAVWDMRDTGAERVEGGDNIVDYVRRALGEAISVHHAHLPIIDITSPTTAEGSWQAEHMHRFADGTDMHGYGLYNETYVKVDGEWKIKTCEFLEQRSDVTPPKATA
jgi:hypothetical protein